MHFKNVREGKIDALFGWRDWRKDEKMNEELKKKKTQRIHKKIVW